MTEEFQPFILLFISIFFAIANQRKIALILIAIAVGRAHTLHIIEPIALAPMGALALLSWKYSAGNLKYRWLKLAGLLVLALGLMGHFFPGFNNPKVLDQVQFSADGLPFTMYLNFDKIMAGLLLLIFLVRPAQWEPFTKPDLRIVFVTLGALCAVLIPLALKIEYVRFDRKPIEWLWLLNNLMFVCMAEEVVFRGVLQARLMLLRPASNSWPYVCVGIAAVAFGLAHFAGGPTYVVLATIAGLGYGYVFLKTRKIEAPILVHFGFNLVHFVFFTYPALAHP